jgi:hypothetical protein
MLFEDEEPDGAQAPTEQHQRTVSPRRVDGSTIASDHSSDAAVGGALPIGRTLESQRHRQAVYVGSRTEGFTTDEAPGDVTIPISLSAPLSTSSGTTIQHLLKHNTHRNHFKDCDASEVVKPPTAATFMESWSRSSAAATSAAAAAPALFPPGKTSPEAAALTLSMRAPKPMSLSKSLLGASQSLAAPLTPTAHSGGGRSPGRVSGTLSPVARSPMTRVNLIPHDLAVNCLDEKQTLTTSELWWKSSGGISDEILQDVPPDLFMEIHYPQQGFYVKIRMQTVPNIRGTKDFKPFLTWVKPPTGALVFLSS